MIPPQGAAALLEESLVVYKGTTTSDGNVGGTTLVCLALAAKADWNGNQIILTSGSYKGQARDINGETDNVTGTVTVANAFDGKVLSGTSFVITGIRTVPAEVAEIQADLDNSVHGLAAIRDLQTSLVYDDFNDNTKNTNIWGTDVTGGASAIANTGGELKITNTSTAGYAYRPTSDTFRKGVSIKSNITVTDGEASGDGQRCEAYIELYLNADNYFQFGLYRDTSETINSRGYVTYKIAGGAETTADVDTTDLDNVEREYKIIVDEHNIHVYLDRALLGTYAFEALTGYTIRLVAGTETLNDTIDIRFDDFEVTPYVEQLRELRAKLDAIQGGTKTLETISTTVDDILDVARSGDSGTYHMAGAGSERNIYASGTVTTPYEFDGGYIDWTGCAVYGSCDTRIRGYMRIESGGSYREFYDETLIAAALPDPILTPVPRDGTTQITPSRVFNQHGLKITATQTAGTMNTIKCEWMDAKT